MVGPAKGRAGGLCGTTELRCALMDDYYFPGHWDHFVFAGNRESGTYCMTQKTAHYSNPFDNPVEESGKPKAGMQKLIPLDAEGCKTHAEDSRTGAATATTSFSSKVDRHKWWWRRSGPSRRVLWKGRRRTMDKFPTKYDGPRKDVEKRVYEERKRRRKTKDDGIMT
ncbi:hypothetical protein GW17_00041158 [Ensete ventricosum]|nr:hypothetical protein GW17_00041158 [Ensete ventricosum]